MKPTVKAPSAELIEKTHAIVQKYDVNTVCFSSKCPNISECFERGVATFMIMGTFCTNGCKFCNVTSAKPQKLNTKEPDLIAKAVHDLGLNYVVITSPDRDDLIDYGSQHFVNTIDTISALNADIAIEVLTPAFDADIKALEPIVVSKAYKLSHNIETVQRLHHSLKPKSSYKKSLQVLEFYSNYKMTKSSLIVGFGETRQEIQETLNDLQNAGVRQLTIGQYLRPSLQHTAVEKFYTHEEFLELKSLALHYGFERVESGILVRSSYYADKL